MDSTRCQTCPDPNMYYSSSGCVCNSGYTLVGLTSLGAQMCVQSSVVSSIESSWSIVSQSWLFNGDV